MVTKADKSGTAYIGDVNASRTPYMKRNSSAITLAASADYAFRLTVAASKWIIDEYRYSKTLLSNDWLIAEINQTYTIYNEEFLYHSVTVNSTTGGTAAGNSSLITSLPMYITINATRSTGYLFSNWTTNCAVAIDHPTNPNNQIYITANNSCYVQANFYVDIIAPVNCTAVGGTITTAGAFTVHTFTGNSSFNVTGNAISATVLVVAGGGGGGRYYSGGGGAGGLLYNTSYANASGNMTVTIGAGGTACASAGCTPLNGQNSVFGVMTATGGGGGRGSSAGGIAGVAGGSGGGAGGTGAASGGTATPSGQGNAGGDTSGSGGAGGGGAGGVGTTKTAGGTGGIGTNYSINGSSFCYAGGGGGSMATPGQATCGGGKGATDAAVAVSGTANTGGGGGGGSSPQVAGSGGSGVVIVRYNTTGCGVYTDPGSLTVNYTSGGTATGDNYTFKPPANLTITATPAENYSFFNWTTNCNGTIASATSANTTIQVNSVSACFAQANFVISYYPIVVSFISQVPADINITNAINSPVKITYNVTGTNLNTSTIKLFFKANSTTDNTMFWLNGTALAGYFDDSFSLTPRTNVSTNYTWTLLDNEIYPGTYNTGPVSIDNKVHTKVTLGSQNNYVLTEFYNVSGTKQWGYYEIMANSTVGANPSSVYYCNSTYTTGDVSLNANCALISTRTATSAFDHCHTNASCHIGFQFAINTTAQTIGSVKVTSTSYFVFGKSKDWNYFTIAGIVRPSMQKTTVNKGLTWTVNNAIIVDTHLHQFDNSENQTFHYYVCANDTAGNETCSSVRTDLMELGELPPSSPNVYSPAEDEIFITGAVIDINYTQSISPNGYSISFYNISLLNSDFTFNKTIYTNNSLNLTYAWNTIGVWNGSFVIRVEAKDVLNQASMGYSGVFNITLSAACTINVTYVTNTTYITNVTGGGMAYLEAKPAQPVGRGFDFLMLGAGLLMGLAFAGLMVKEGFGKQ
jgi:hypothetical protein